MKLRIIRNRWLPVRGFAAINLFGLIFVRQNAHVNPALLNHELIHTRQQLELLFVPFYIWYVTEWLIRWLCCRDRHKAYRDICFEREAYCHQEELRYLTHRRFYAWLRS